jgi:hypothetical protein
MSKEIYMCKCGKNGVRIEESAYEGVDDWMYSMTNGRQETGYYLNPQLAEMMIKGLQEYLKVKGVTVIPEPTHKEQVEELYSKLAPIMAYCSEWKCWDEEWDTFWNIKDEYNLDIHWCDPDTRYEEDMLAYFNAVCEEMNNEQ